MICLFPWLRTRHSQFEMHREGRYGGAGYRHAYEISMHHQASARIVAAFSSCGGQLTQARLIMVPIEASYGD